MVIKVLRLLALVLLLNIARYLVAPVLEVPLIFEGLFGAMAANPQHFNSDFTSWDFLTSYAYNGAMWLTMTLLFHLLRPALRGSDMVASLKTYALGWLFFASVSGIYMNHYSHPGDFYAWNVADAVIAFGVVALVNGVAYRRVMGPSAADARA